MTTTRDRLLAIASTYAEAKGVSLARVSTLAGNDGKLLARVAAGRDITTGTYDEMVRWFSAHWPDGVPWPDEAAGPSVFSKEA